MFKDFFQKQTRNHLICLRYSYCLEDSKTISRASLENQRFRVSGQNYGKNVIEMHIFEPKSEQKVSLSSHFFLKVNTNKKQSPEVFFEEHWRTAASYKLISCVSDALTSLTILTADAENYV